MRATFLDLETASLMGINSNRIYSFTFVLGAGLAAASGALLGPIFTVHPYIGNLANLKAFTIVIFGGLGSFTGAITAGLLLGVFESLGAAISLRDIGRGGLPHADPHSDRQTHGLFGK
jgi:branched-chain amino acid transport system permease protein